MSLLNETFESAQGALGRGLSAARETVSGVALENFGFVKDFIHMCDQGWSLGWHERNGGNASYRLTPEEVESAYSFFSPNVSDWIEIGVQENALAGAYFLVTASGSFMQNIAADPKHSIGIVEINEAGDAYRICWGLRDGGKPTSEFSGHFLIHAVRMKATDNRSRVLYHAHPTSIIVLSKVLPLDACTFSRVLWKSMTECVMVFPEGVGVVGFEVPGSLELARASAREMEKTSAVIWAHHGLLCAGDNFDDAFSRMHAIVKAADIEIQTRLLVGSCLSSSNSSSQTMGNVTFNRISDSELRSIAHSLDLTINEEFLSQ